MKDVSNNVLVSLAVVAIVAVTFSILVNMNMINQMTGAASTGSGSANVSIPSTLDITLQVSTVNFTTTNPGITKDSEDLADIEPDTTINITNDGSVPVNISVSIAGTDDLFTGSQDAESFMCKAETGNNLTINLGALYADCRNSAEPINNFVGSLNYSNNADSVEVHFNITVPGDEPSGLKGAGVTFTASAAA